MWRLSEGGGRLRGGSPLRVTHRVGGAAEGGEGEGRPKVGEGLPKEEADGGWRRETAAPPWRVPLRAPLPGCGYRNYIVWTLLLKELFRDTVFPLVPCFSF